jgi:hypothetical protein
MSAWKAAAGPPGPGQGSRLQRDRQSRLTGLDRIPVARPFGFHARIACCERALHGSQGEAARPVSFLMMETGKRYKWIGVDANCPRAIVTHNAHMV